MALCSLQNLGALFESQAHCLQTASSKDSGPVEKRLSFSRQESRSSKKTGLLGSANKSRKKKTAGRSRGASSGKENIGAKRGNEQSCSVLKTSKKQRINSSDTTVKAYSIIDPFEKVLRQSSQLKGLTKVTQESERSCALWQVYDFREETAPFKLLKRNLSTAAAAAAGLPREAMKLTGLHGASTLDLSHDHVGAGRFSILKFLGGI